VKKTEFNILLFLLLYLVLKYGFYLYVGFVTPGGKLFFSFPERYLNFPYWLTVAVAKLSKLLLEICGYAVYQKNAANITIEGSRGVTLAWGCLGAGAISLWIAFITAHRTKDGYKLKWIVAGCLLIFIVNILRIDMIALSNYYNWKYFQSFNAHTSFDALTYAIILLIMLVFVISYNKKKKKLTSGNA
jgi:exosortase/archaeosortase family protein